MIVVDEKMAQFLGCVPQTYGDWSDPTGEGVGRRYTHFLHHVLQTTLNVGQCESGVSNEIVLAYFLDFFRKGPPHHEAQCLLELGFCPRFLLGRGLPPKSVHLAVGASFFGQQEGWPNSFTLAALRGEFFRESSHPPTPSVRLMACPFPEGEADAH